MAISLGVVMDPIEAINPKKDSSLAMLLAAQKRGWTLYYFTQENLLIDNGIAYGYGQQISVANNLDQWYSASEPQLLPLGDLDVILMRKDPPFDSQFLYTTFLLESAQRQGVLVVNNPQSLRDCNEKVFATEFPQCCPPVLISANSNRIRQFHNEHGDIILKPLDGMGGASARRVMKMMQGGDGMPSAPVKLQVNQRHPIIKGLSNLVQSDSDTAELIANQLLDNALATANLLDDPREMIARSYQAIEKLANQ